jgi:hypothetical protein
MRNVHSTCQLDWASLSIGETMNESGSQEARKSNLEGKKSGEAELK